MALLFYNGLLCARSFNKMWDDSRERENLPGWSHASTSNSNSQREIVTNDQQGQQFPPYGRTPTSHPYGNTSPYPVFGQPSQRQTGTNYQQLPAHDISGITPQFPVCGQPSQQQSASNYQQLPAHQSAVGNTPSFPVYGQSSRTPRSFGPYGEAEAANMQHESQSPFYVDQGDEFHPTSRARNSRSRVQRSTIPTLDVRTGHRTNGSSTSPMVFVGGNSRSRQSRSNIRGDLFRSAPDRQRLGEGTRTFTQKIVLLKDFEPQYRPCGREAAILASKGFCAKDVEFDEQDDYAAVIAKIVEAHPLLTHLMGGIRMHQQDGPGNSTRLAPLGNPVLNGRQIKDSNLKFIYVSMLSAESFPDAVILSGVLVRCPKCFKQFDMAVMVEHGEICEGVGQQTGHSERESIGEHEGTSETVGSNARSRVPMSIGNASNAPRRLSYRCDDVASTSACCPVNARAVATAESSPVEEVLASTSGSRSAFNDYGASLSTFNDVEHSDLDLFENLKREYLIVSDGDALSNNELCNPLLVHRNGYMECAVNAASDADFMMKIRLPLKINFHGELGLDHGALRLDFVSLVMDDVSQMLPTVHQLYLNSLNARNVRPPPSCLDAESNSTGEEVSNEELDVPSLNKRLFAFGLFSAIGVIQCNLLEPYITKWANKLSLQGRPDREHPFVEGLEVLGVATFATKPQMQSLFKQRILTLPAMLSCLELEYREDEKTTKILKSICFAHFTDFLKLVADGSVKSSAEVKMTLEQIFKFVTGSKSIPLALTKNGKITVSFVVNPDGSLLRPSALVCYSKLKMPYTESVSEMISIWKSAIFDGGDGFHLL